MNTKWCLIPNSAVFVWSIRSRCHTLFFVRYFYRLSSFPFLRFHLSFAISQELLSLDFHLCCSISGSLFSFFGFSFLPLQIFLSDLFETWPSQNPFVSYFFAFCTVVHEPIEEKPVTSDFTNSWNGRQLVLGHKHNFDGAVHYYLDSTCYALKPMQL